MTPDKSYHSDYSSIGRSDLSDPSFREDFIEECYRGPSISHDSHHGFNRSHSSNNFTEDDEPHQQRSPNRHTPAPPILQRTERQKEQKKTVPTNDDQPWIKLILGAVILIIISFILWRMTSSSGGERPAKDKECTDAFRSLRDAHPEQDIALIRGAMTASKGLINSSIHSVVFLYKATSNQAFMDDLLNSSIKCTETGNVSPIRLTKDSFTPIMQRDFGYVLTTFKDTLREAGIMLVRDLDRIPKSIAESFHTICDTESPWVKPSTIYFTMEVPVEQPVTMENMDRVATGMLRDKWNHLPANILEPLITRITDQVLFIN